MRAAEEGWVGDELTAEFAGLGLAYLPAQVGQTKDDVRLVKARLLGVEAYFSGAFITTLPTRPVTAAYRVLYRQIGLDPDVDRTLLERIARDRLWRGRFRPRGVLADALTIAAVETEIPVLALRADEVIGPLGISTARDGEALEGEPLMPGALVVADAARPLGVLFDDPERPSPYAAGKDDVDVVLYAAIVPGVSRAIADEALWLAAELLGPQPD